MHLIDILTQIISCIQGISFFILVLSLIDHMTYRYSHLRDRSDIRPTPSREKKKSRQVDTPRWFREYRPSPLEIVLSVTTIGQH